MEKNNNDRFFILHYPSPFGMGTSTDVFLVRECDLICAIKQEIERFRKGQRFSDRLVGCWNDEKFLKTDDVDKIVQDVIRKRQASCSTYSEYKDLIEIPKNISVVETTTDIGQCVFRVYNQFRSGIDVIAGHAIFRQYYINLGSKENLLGLESGKIHEFTGFQFENVLIHDNIRCAPVDQVIKREERLIENLKGEKSKDVYIFDLIPEYATEDRRDEWIKDCMRNISKLSEVVLTEGDYYEYLYKGRDNNRIYSYLLELEENDRRTAEMGKETFIVPPDRNKPGIEYMEDSGSRDEYFCFNELFKRGPGIKGLFAAKTDTSEDMDTFKGISIQNALMYAFGND